MFETKVRETILNLFGQKPILNNISPDQDFFDVGASSLTIVDLQIQVEEALSIAVPTSRLMTNPTINGWVEAYVESKS
jgi:acyl carrier protein